MKSITYRFEVTATMPLAESDDDVDFYTEAVAVSMPRRAELQRELHKLLRKFADASDCDCQILDFSVEEDGDTPMTSEDARDAEEDRQWKEGR